MAECTNCGTTKFNDWNGIFASERLAHACHTGQMTDDLHQPGVALPVYCPDCADVLSVRTWPLCDFNSLFDGPPPPIAVKLLDFHESFLKKTPTKKRPTQRLDQDGRSKRQRVELKTPPAQQQQPPRAPVVSKTDAPMDMLTRSDIAANLFPQHT